MDDIFNTFIAKKGPSFQSQNILNAIPENKSEIVSTDNDFKKMLETYYQLSEDNYLGKEKANICCPDNLKKNIFDIQLTHKNIKKTLNHIKSSSSRIKELANEYSLKCDTIYSNFENLNSLNMDATTRLESSSLIEKNLWEVMNSISHDISIIKSSYNEKIQSPSPLLVEICNSVKNEIEILDKKSKDLEEEKSNEPQNNSNVEDQIPEIIEMLHNLILNNTSNILDLARKFYEIKNNSQQLFLMYYNMTPDQYISKNKIRSPNLLEIESMAQTLKSN